jgi:hypothetical protein
MRRLAALVLVAAAGAASPSLAQPAPGPASATSAPVDPERLAIAREVIQLGFPPERRQQMFARVIEAMMAQSRTALVEGQGRQIEPGAEPIFQRYLDRARIQTERAIADASPALFDSFARAYARAFTRDELVQIRAFVATPAGAKYVQRSSDLLSDPDVAQANTAYMQRIFADLQPLQADLQRELKEYFAKRRK